jgi:hypothetical protein
MPLVRISAIRGKPAAPLPELGAAVHRALVETVGVPEHLGIARTEGIVMIDIAFSSGRTLDQKRALYRRISERSFGNGIVSYAP